MKNFLKKGIDVIMTFLFIILMGYHITGNKVHEILGIITFVLFILHNILNIKWYKTVFKGKYGFYRTLQATTNLLLLIAMINLIISGIIISAEVFAFLGITTTMFGRNLHMVSNSWAFILMSIHVGLHLNTLLNKIKERIKDSVFEYIYYLLLLLSLAGGMYVFISSGLWKDMLLITKFKLFDYSQSPYLFYLGQFAILTSFAIMAALLKIGVINKSKRSK